MTVRQSGGGFERTGYQLKPTDYSAAEILIFKQAE